MTEDEMFEKPTRITYVDHNPAIYLKKLRDLIILGVALNIVCWGTILYVVGSLKGLKDLLLRLLT